MSLRKEEYEVMAGNSRDGPSARHLDNYTDLMNKAKKRQQKGSARDKVSPITILKDDMKQYSLLYKKESSQDNTHYQPESQVAQVKKRLMSKPSVAKLK